MRFKKSFVLIFASTFFLFPFLANAQGTGNALPQRRTVGDARNLLNEAVAPTGIRRDDARSITGSIINRALQLVGTVFLLLMVYGGITWMTARGNDDRVKKAKQTITAAIIGIVLVVSAYAITYLVTESALGRTSTTQQN